MSLDELVAVQGQLLVVHGVQIRRINALLGVVEEAADPRLCPVCGKPVPTNGDGGLLPHQIDGAVLAPGRRRSGSVCRYRPEVASSVTSTVSTVDAGAVA